MVDHAEVGRVDQVGGEVVFGAEAAVENVSDGEAGGGSDAAEWSGGDVEHRVEGD